MQDFNKFAENGRVGVTVLGFLGKRLHEVKEPLSVNEVIEVREGAEQVGDKGEIFEVQPSVVKIGADEALTISTSPLPPAQSSAPCA